MSVLKQCKNFSVYYCRCYSFTTLQHIFLWIFHLHRSLECLPIRHFMSTILINSSRMKNKWLLNWGVGLRLLFWFRTIKRTNSTKHDKKWRVPRLCTFTRERIVDKRSTHSSNLRQTDKQIGSSDTSYILWHNSWQCRELMTFFRSLTTSSSYRSPF